MPLITLYIIQCVYIIPEENKKFYNFHLFCILFMNVLCFKKWMNHETENIFIIFSLKLPSHMNSKNKIKNKRSYHNSLHFTVYRGIKVGFMGLFQPGSNFSRFGWNFSLKNKIQVDPECSPHRQRKLSPSLL